MYRTTLRRSGFTLVEIMVAAGLMILMMAIIATAFQSSLQTLSHLRSMGNLADRLRIAQERLRTDLEAQHFEADHIPQGQTLADIRYDFTGTSLFQLPRAGYFHLDQPQASIYEGIDTEGLASTRSVTTALEFTTRRQPRTPDLQFVGVAPELTAAGQSLNDTDPNGLYVAEWARIRWSLGNATVVDGVTTYTLYRNTRLLANNFNGMATATSVVPGSLTENVVSTFGGAAQNLFDTTPITNRTPIIPFPPGHPNYGDDIVLTNVLSFEVKVAWQADATWDPTLAGHAAGTNRQPRRLLPPPTLNAPIDRVTATGTEQNPDFPFDDMPYPVYDTSPLTPGDVNTIPFRARISALLIKLRVYDVKNKMTRQASMIVPF